MSKKWVSAIVFHRPSVCAYRGNAAVLRTGRLLALSNTPPRRSRYSGHFQAFMRPSRRGFTAVHGYDNPKTDSGAHRALLTVSSHGTRAGRNAVNERASDLPLAWCGGCLHLSPQFHLAEEQPVLKRRSGACCPLQVPQDASPDAKSLGFVPKDASLTKGFDDLAVHLYIRASGVTYYGNKSFVAL